MGKMPAGLKRYWANKRRGGRKMARRSRRKGRGRAWGRRAKRGVRRAVGMGPRLFGFKKDGFHASDAVIVGSALSTIFIPGLVVNNVGYSPMDILANKNNIAPTMGDKVRLSLASAGWTAMGIKANNFGGGLTVGYNNTPTSGIAGFGVLAGCAMKIAGKFVNPWMRGSAIKL